MIETYWISFGNWLLLDFFVGMLWGQAFVKYEIVFSSYEPIGSYNELFP